MDKTSTNPAAQPASRACAHLKLSPEAQRLLKEGQTLASFQALLVEKDLYADAIRVSAACLPPAHVVWWGMLCLWSLARPEPTPPFRAVLQAVLAWLREPSDQHRRNAEAAGRAAGITTPAGGLGLAVFLSGGSLAPAGQPAVGPEPHLAAKTLSAALVQATQKLPPEQTSSCQAQFLAIAHEVAQGNLKWTRSEESTHADPLGTAR